MFRKIVFSAVVSGLVAGILITVLQLMTVIPMVLEAETYEKEAPQTSAQVVQDDAKSAHEHEAEEWAPEDGLERTYYTAITNVLVGIGFSILLAVCFSFIDSIDWRKGLLWGLGGFIAFQLAPALGLPPELPGTVSGTASSRQVWWIVTVIATSAGLIMLAYNASRLIKIAGVLLIILPHVVGAPKPYLHFTTVPQDLATNFVILSLIVSCVFWLMLGGLTGYTFNKFK